MDKNLEIVFRLSAIHSKILKSIDSQLSIHGTTFSEFFVIYQLATSPNKMLKRIDLADKVGMSASGVTRLLSPMEKLKIIQKEASPRDARVSFVKLTEAGEELFDNALKSLHHTAQGLFEDLDESDIDHLFRILKKIG